MTLDKVERAWEEARHKRLLEFAAHMEEHPPLPIANVSRIMKAALPKNAKVSKEARELMQECATEFVAFITSEVQDEVQQEHRKTIQGEDVLDAMRKLSFENYAEALKIYLARYREDQLETEKQKSNTARRGGQARAGPSRRI